MSEKTYDLVVIGSGPAGIQAAMQAAKTGKKVAVVEKTPSKIGGSWIHLGTLPSKTLREGLDAVHAIESHVGPTWVKRVVDDLHTGKIYGRSRKVAEEEEALIRGYLAKNKIDVIEGYGVLESRYRVRVIPRLEKPFVLKTDFIMLATGSSPRRPDNIPFDSWRVIDSDDVLDLDHIPNTLVIYGAGVIGCEYACIFRAMGVNVTVVDARTRIMQYLDFEVSDALKASMEGMGVKFVMGVTLDEVLPDGPMVTTTYSDGSQLQSQVFFFAAGRVSNTSRIGAEKLDIEINNRSAIVVNEHFQTAISNIYAAGDAIGSPALAATSLHQGRYVACHAFGIDIDPFPKDFPIGVYTIPELSMVGQTEEELTKEKIPYVVGRAHYREIARGYIRGDSHGLLKLLIHKETHRILGIHIMGHDACNLVHIGLAFMVKDGIAQDLIHLIFNYPTLAEGYRIAAFNALNKIFKDGIIRSPKGTSAKVKKKVA